MPSMPWVWGGLTLAWKAHCCGQARCLIEPTVETEVVALLDGFPAV
ncbi:hypothetical protein JKG47_01895 [Acidithiobacillus sp. MC6.1]|nr:hypothetical protein [Acidithiobacillus sp. MC6.1]